MKSEEGGRPTAAGGREDEEILEGIADVARRHLGWEGVLAPGLPIARALALDSLRRLTLVVEIENRFRVCLEEEDEAALETVGDLVNAIKKRRRSEARADK